ncbi:NAD-dependent protein deacylase [Oceanobacillus manasiensis]|uniref:NAD-dependent protein deacylase n=1 Tax=Oceanobacillus manasiensis TaxID=586413 RepID=UPI0005A662AC|nr:NAD-dependent protein deacylase [Oceanobacillus manasiensis]
MLKQWIDEATYTVVFTGAGMSTESGLPDFRSANEGLWNNLDPSEIASTDALNRNVHAFTEFYRQRVLGVKTYEPHKGHYILADWEKQGKIKSIITQNVDGFHQAAGSKQVAELHGTLQTLHCQSCKKQYSSEAYIDKEYHCLCGGILRPSIVLFGEALPQDAFQKAYKEAQACDLIIVLGSSLSVTPANQFPLIAKGNGAKLVIINREETSLDFYADLIINKRNIGDILKELDS